MIKGFAFKGPDVPKASKRKSYVKKKYPARLAGSKINYVVNKAVAKAMNGVSENKIVGLTSYNETAPVANQALSLAYNKTFTVGSIPSVWSGITGLSPLGGMTFPPGNGPSQMNGRYIYLQKTHFSIEIDMSIDLDYAVPTEFRVVCFKTRRSNSPAGITHSYANTLFLNTDGTDFGHATSGITGSDLMLQPLNRKDWDIKSDKRFMLSSPAPANGIGTTVSTSSKYPVFKRLVYNLPYYAKTEITGNVPADLDTNYVVAIYARSLAKDAFASKWEVTTRGSTTFKDN